MTETIDGQRQYILYLERQVSILIGRLGDLGQDLGDARNREITYLNRVEFLEREIFTLEQERAKLDG